MGSRPARGVVLALAGIVLLLPSCGDQGTGTLAADRRAASASPSGAGTAPGTPSAPGTASGTGGTAAGPSPASSPSPTANPANQIRLEIEMAACIERGRPATATIRSIPGAMIGASAAYADGESHNNYWLGATDTRGEFPIAWTPPAEAPLGTAKILAGASSEQGGATGSREFRLAAPGGCG